MTFDMSLHRISVLVGNSTRTAGGEERAPIRRQAWDPLYDGVPRNVRRGGYNRWVWGVHHHQMTVVGVNMRSEG